MKNTWIIAFRELKERVKSRSFLFMAILGPLLVLGFCFVIFSLSGSKSQKWNVLISDPNRIFDTKISANKLSNVKYSFLQQYVELEDFKENKSFEDYDALIEINEKVYTNKTVYVFYKEKPSYDMGVRLRYDVERRLEELYAVQIENLSLAQIRSIKKPINFGFRDVYDPENKGFMVASWVGVFLGAMLLFFVFLFGMSNLRSVNREKSSRIIEILLATVSPRQLLSGKLIGIGLAAFVQLIIWVFLIGIGLYFFRNTLFLNQYDAKNISEGLIPSDYNNLVELVFTQLKFGTILFYFSLFLIGSYVFYGSVFASLGAASGTESDGQQFLLPCLFLLAFSIYGGYYYIEHPTDGLSTFFQYFPFTSPVIAMIRLLQGYDPSELYQLFVSLAILFLSGFVALIFAGRLFKNGLLNYGHELRWNNVFKWIKTK